LGQGDRCHPGFNATNACADCGTGDIIYYKPLEKSLPITRVSVKLVGIGCDDVHAVLLQLAEDLDWEATSLEFYEGLTVTVEVPGDLCHGAGAAWPSAT
jgi:hypothetical protein